MHAYPTLEGEGRQRAFCELSGWGESASPPPGSRLTTLADLPPPGGGGRMPRVQVRPLTGAREETDAARSRREEFARSAGCRRPAESLAGEPGRGAGGNIGARRG